MADITMCDGGTCKVKETCFRFKAIPSPHWQSYFQGIPVTDIGCEYFWKIDFEDCSQIDVGE
jgi:hypothetical protein